MEYDKSTAGKMLGRRISGIALKRRKPGVEKVACNRIYFLFDDGTGFEMFCTGEIFPCQEIEAFDLHSLTKRGSNAYDNEFLGIANPDGEGCEVLINKPFKLDC